VAQNLAGRLGVSKFERTRVLSTRVLYDGPNRRIVADSVEFADKSNYEYVYFENGRPACVLALTRDNKVVLTKQYRHPLRKIIVNLPGGAVEEGEDVFRAAQREFEEETGFTVERLLWLGRYSPGPNSNVIVDLFFTRDIHQKGEFDKNETISVEFTDFKILLEKVLSGECFDSALSIAVMLTALKKLA
jgi:ADP-ribose pyrophosphatase